MKRNNTVLVVDGGGRGAVLVHKYSLSKHVGKLIAVPGNDLMKINCKKSLKIFPSLKTTSIKEIIEICKKEKVDLVDVAQDNAVEVGLTDELNKEGISAIGPTRLAGQIEWDKSWSRDFMKKNNISIPGYKIFSSKNEAKQYVSRNPNKKFFIKVSGLADGKGAIPAQNKEEALLAIDQMSKFGKAGENFIIEDWLEGEEFSTFAICDGETSQIIGSAQDHKRLNDGDLGPNTGGIGASSPPKVLNKNIYKQVVQIIKKTINGLAKEGRPYKGILYLGAILVNVKKIKVVMDKKTRIAVTGSLRNGVPTKNRELFGLKKVLGTPGIKIYGSRVTKSNGKFYVSAGRLFHLVAEGKTILEVREKAYKAMSQLYIEGNNLHYRTDIGWRDVEREKI
ncbi:MAG: Phosphoribosylamine-glycine ligase [Microgenomates group bacterium GW2011_GWA2_37_6]|nr:MAG: Phosphoribosylamine-glycine ligase [Microgenomates group bacterium GW2011_GWA2_37_6]